jgi:hypothetical protein
MKVELKKTKSESKKKYSVRFLDGPHKDKIVYFGGKGYSDYTIHGNPGRMRLYVRRHGGLVPKSTMRESNPDKIHDKMLRVGRSGKEDWTAWTPRAFGHAGCCGVSRACRGRRSTSLVVSLSSSTSRYNVSNT